MARTERRLTRLAVATVLAAFAVRAAAQTPGAPDMHIPAPLGPCTSYSAVTPEDIWKGGASDAAWKKYENECVRWTLPLKTVRPTGDTTLVYLGAGSAGQTVVVIASLAETAQLKAAKPDDKVEVQGRITWVRADRIALHETTLNLPKVEAK